MSRPIFYLQTLLRQLSVTDPRLLPLIPSGYYDRSTEAAVTAFQEAYGLPTTGIVDQRTWDLVKSAHEGSRASLFQPPALLFWPPELILRPGETHPQLPLAQFLLTTLGNRDPRFRLPDISGTLDPDTTQALRFLQAASGRQETGNLDLATWNDLVRLYRIAVHDFDRG